MSTKPLDIYFNQEVQIWRRGAAVSWTLLLVAPAFLLFATIGNISLRHPLSWIAWSFLKLFSISTWIHIGIFTIAFGILIISYTKHFTVIPTIHSTRWNAIWSLIGPRRLIHICVNGFLGGICVWCYVGVVQGRYKGFSMTCPESRDKWCLNESYVFLVVHGCLVAATFTSGFFAHGYNYISFPVIQQSKFFQAQINILPIARKSISATIMRLPYYYLSYYLILGQLIKSIVLRNLNILESADVQPVNSLWILLDYGLFWNVLFSGSLLWFLLSLSTYIYKIYVTEPYEFPVETAMEEFHNKCLSNAVTCEKNKTVQYLGYLDLYLLSKHSPVRRQQVFSLTQLGGHPHNWNAICSAILELLQAFSHRLAEYNGRIMAGGSMRQPSGDRQHTKTSVAGSHVPEVNTSSNLTYRGTQDRVNEQQQQPALQKKTALDVAAANLKKTRVIAFFFGEHPDACSRQMFAEAQKYIWALEAIAYLVCASFSEDRFGVVQKSLPEVITCLLTLHEDVEKHLRLVPGNHRKAARDDDVITDVTLRQALKSSLKSAIYRIVTTFHSHMTSIPLGSERTRRLNLFMEYRE